MTRQEWSVADLTLEEKVGQMIMVRYPDRALLEEMLAQGWAGSYYFGMKGLSPEQVGEELNRLQRLAKIPALVAFGFACTDFGTGLVQGNLMRVGATRSPELAYRLAFIEATEQRAYGFHIPGLPVVDVNTNRANPIINTRALSDDPELVTELSLELLRGQINARALTCAMHFPGHGATSQDSHILMPVDDRSLDELRALDLRPYRAGIAAGLINGICTNHIHYPAFDPEAPIPATVSRRIVTGLLREELGYDGIIMTDSLTMKAMKEPYGIEEAAILSVLAGHDIILQDYQSEPLITHRALVAAVESGRITLAQVDASVQRILSAKAWLGLFDNCLVDLEGIETRIATPEYQAFALELARAAVTVLEDRALPLPVSDHTRCLVIANGNDPAVNIDMDITHLPTHKRLYREMHRRLPHAETLTLSEEMPAGEIAAARQAIAKADVVVFGLFTRVLCYHEDAIGLAPAYADLVREAVASGKPVALLNFGNPYVMADLPPAPAALCTYDEDCPESIQAAVEALFGEIRAVGKLPVKVSDRYPFGCGL
jgi:beta-N-acetylhexosaminidase